ncbi:MAG: 50S ribosomal protein L30 [Deltaproteobacteria bacterium]|nr:50S ribosomal protein L30 [Deltaproteobacteria bacterium]MBI3076536.1 50S ribosomal protein L30 [Deltaproteobacteria bacterium]
MARKLVVSLRRSVIGYPVRQRQTVRGLGLRRLHQTVVVDDTPAVRGMLQHVAHLVEVRESAGEER